MLKRILVILPALLLMSQSIYAGATVKVADQSFNVEKNNAFTGSLLSAVSSGNPPYRFTSMNQPENGAVVVYENGVFNFTPNFNFTGSTNFKYIITDATGATSEPATVTLLIEE